jgi:GTPase SAR1 family protein
MNIENKKIKIGIIGDEFTGKTNILNVFNNQNFNEHEVSTNGCIKIIKKINIIHKNFELIFTNISGEER